MEKLFNEVFPSLSLTGELAALMRQVTVEKVSINKSKDSLRVYISSERWIHKKRIYELENQIKSQIFANVRMRVKVYESFRLSEQYTPENFLNAYRSSIELELKNYSMLVYSIFSNARIEFDSETSMRIISDQSVVSINRGEELCHILEKIFCERSNFPRFSVNIQYEKNTENKALKDSLLRIEQEAIRISKKSPKSPPVDKKPEKPPLHPQKRPGSADLIYGRDFEDTTISIDNILSEMEEVTIRGKIISLESRAIRGDKTLFMLSVTDFTDSIKIKLFVKNEIAPEISASLKEGDFIKIRGTTNIDRFDGELSIGNIYGIKHCANFTHFRMDDSPKKRVELHCHTKMSDMDGVSDVSDIIECAFKWGMSAIAITDHGVVQAFPEALHAVEAIVPADSDFKVIYGMEAYIVDDEKGVTGSINDASPSGIDLKSDFVVFDLETTGFSPVNDRIIEIGAVRIEDGKITDNFSSFVNPRRPIPFKIEELTGISDSMTANAPTIDEVLPKFLDFTKGAALVAHNAAFDASFIRCACKELGYEYSAVYVDTVGIARLLLPHMAKHKLDKVAKALNVPLQNHHRAVDDAMCTALVFLKMVSQLEEREIFTLSQLDVACRASLSSIQKATTYHAIILAKNETGRINLYRLVSQSHIKYYYRRPRIPKSLLTQYREGLIVGSACEAGELYRALVGGQSDDEIARIVSFYDYLEIQPLGNNAFMIRDSTVESEEELKDFNRRIVKLGEQFNKPVVATCDVHFLNPEDEIYRRIIMAGKGFADADLQAPLFLRTTDEMLKEFEYLGSAKASEVVIENTLKISDMCEKISPIHPDKFPPKIENSDKDLHDICYSKAHEIYGPVLPKIVEKRLSRELDSIISNGYAVMYIIAQKLVWKSNEDGYLVGSRGSVGSSLAATMAGITEVNPLSPHYRCPKCYFTDFDSDEVKSYFGGAGCDMPDRLCPNCKTPLAKDGFDIPFETFLGFKGNKEPDIDLNFSGEYQAKAHKYTEVIFGKGQTLKAGTIGTLAEKTAFGYVKKYFEERGIDKRSCEIERLAKGCTGIRRTTGQHPGGIIVLPIGEDINMFTPIQHPANDMESDIITTHFDYHSIDGNLLKLDILGHDDPTMIRMLEDLTGLFARDVPLDDKEVMSLFASPAALGVTPEDILDCPLGCLGIPEFGTDFAMQMLIDTKPTKFSDLVRIAGLAHGTDVWLGNAQTLIENGDATISTAICTRDDIMVYLIQKGVDNEHSFKIMESVRKGKGLTPEMEKEMRDHNVPDWYIWSCKKIKYMFPKAHAAAYVMMAYRIAWFKVNIPLAYYAAFFSIRATAFDYASMCQGQTRLEAHIADYKKRMDTLTKKEEDTLRDMRIVQEMYARGYDFMPIDIYRSKAHRFQIVDGRLLPSLDAIEGLGDKAADAVEAASKNGRYLSRDDFRERTKVSKTVVDTMNTLGLFGNLPESNQLSIFDLA